MGNWKIENRRQRGRVDWALDLKSGHPKFEPRSHSQLDLFAFSAPRIHIQLICAQVPSPQFFSVSFQKE